jgi:(2Fe-2S) ferredoxin
MQEQNLPHKKIVFVCINQREKSERTCCGSKDGAALHARLKELVRERGYRTKIRISKSGCMDRCEAGANMMVFPDNVWLSHVEDGDLKALVDRLVAEVETEAP